MPSSHILHTSCLSIPNHLPFDQHPLTWYNHPRRTLGVRLVVGQQTLDLYAEVRILDPQPDIFLSLQLISTPRDILGVLSITQ